MGMMMLWKSSYLCDGPSELSGMIMPVWRRLMGGLVGAPRRQGIPEPSWAIRANCLDGEGT